MDDILPKQNSDTVMIKLQADGDGRYGFNVKVIELNFEIKKIDFENLGW
jgi:hypothetical protein